MTCPDVCPRTFIVGGNFKMNGDRNMVNEIIGNIRSKPVNDRTEVYLGIPAPFLKMAVDLKPKGCSIAAQNCYKVASGAYTGEISPKMLTDIGVEWVILGHSERRSIFGESDQLVAEKVAFAVQCGLKVAACIGETFDEREAGKTEEVIFRQIQAIACKLKTEDWRNVVIAYEPVWAIGTGRTASPKQAQEVHRSLRAYIATKIDPIVAKQVRIQYGGSVTGANCDELAQQPDIDGFLVGGASLKPEFVDIINAKHKPS